MESCEGRSVDEPTVQQQLFDEAPAFDFFQAVRMLRLAAHRPGHAEPPLGDVVRFSTNPSLDFPASTVYDLAPPARPDEPPQMTVNFLGLYGASGVLPRHYTELIRRVEFQRRDRERSALRKWLDLFNHRFIALFYEAWEKYRFWLMPERGAWTNAEPDTFTLCLLSLIGLGTPGTRGRFRIPPPAEADARPSGGDSLGDLALLRYAGLLAQRKRNVHGLEQMLGDYFGCRAQVLQFRGRWLPLAPDQQTQLGTGEPIGVVGQVSNLPGQDGILPRKATVVHSPVLGECGQACQLGVDTVVGDRIWDVESMVRIRLGPLDGQRFVDFLPDASPSAKGKSVFLLGQLVRFYLGPHLDWEVQLVLEGRDVRGCRLTDDAPGPRLGWNTWLDPNPCNGDADDAVFTADECSLVP
jgi:type VI secretion system protein ImpH